MHLSTVLEKNIFEQFILAEDKRLLLEVQTYLLEHVDDKLDLDVELTGDDKLKLMTNVGLMLNVRLASGSSIRDLNVYMQRAHSHLWSSAPRSLDSLIAYVNACVASLENYDVLAQAGASYLRDYVLVDNVNIKVSANSEALATDKEAADYFFKKFPTQVISVLIDNGVYDREKLLSAYEVKSMSAVLKHYLSDEDSLRHQLDKLVALIVAHDLKAADEVDVKDIAANSNLGELKHKLNGAVYSKLSLAINKATRSDDDRAFDNENDRFIFVGHEKLEPVPGTEYHRKTLEIERLIKANRFDVKDHGALSMMKMRARIHNANTYMVTIPKDGISDDDIENPPKWLVDLIDKHKVKI